MKQMIRGLVVAALVSVGFVATGTAVPTATGSQEPTLSDYAASMRKIPVGVEPHRERTLPSGRDEVCKEISDEDPTEDLAAFNPNAGVLWPGSLVQYATLSGGTLSEVTAKREKLVVYVDNAVADPAEGGRPVLVPNTRRQVKKPSASNLEKARLAIVSQHLVTPPNFFVTAKQSFSLEHGLFQVGLDARWLSSSVRASLKSSTYQARRNYTFKLTQQFYTLAAEPPREPSGWFKRGETVEHLRQLSDPSTNPITFVRSVTYGRVAFLTVSSTESEATTQAAMTAVANWATGSATANLDSQHASVLNNSEVHLWVYGGGWDNGQAVEGKTVNITEADKVGRLASYLRPSGKADLRWGLPISYRADFIGDKRSAAVKRATRYTRCQPAPKLIDNIRLAFHVNDDDKDKNSVLGIQIIGSDNRVYAAASNVGSGDEWSDEDDEAVNIPISIPITATDLTGMRLEVCMASRGDDTFKFNLTIRGRRSTSPNPWVGQWNNQEVHENACIRQTLPGY